MPDSAWTLLVIFLIPNVLGFLFMGMDKARAKKGAFRIPEAVLFCMAIIGGSPGCLLGMRVFRHKIRKPAFFIGMPLILVLQLLCVFFLWRSDLTFRFV